MLYESVLTIRIGCLVAEQRLSMRRRDFRA
jgi:hypothetical protein